MDRRVSLIVASYNQPKALVLVLEGLLRQSYSDFELVVADDGSDDDTRELVESYAERVPFPLIYTTQEDRGFRKAKALNNAIRRAEGEVLLFMDGDCIARSDWIEVHLNALATGFDFSVAGYVRLNLEKTQSLTVESVQDGSFENVVTDAERREHLKIHWKELFYRFLRKSRKPKIRGGNWAVTRKALEVVNGFDENFDGFSKEDSDIRNRLLAAGFRGCSVWDRNWMLHCDHSLDKRRVRPDVVRSEPDLNYYESRVDTSRCSRGLVDERELQR